MSLFIYLYLFINIACLSLSLILFFFGSSEGPLLNFNFYTVEKKVIMKLFENNL